MKGTAEPTLGGQWALAIIMILIAFWIVYKYVAPKGWKEWRNAGILQAFIIALYAEMYGFPLTVYLLTSVLGIEIPLLHIKGHVWSTLLGVGDWFAFVEMFVGYLFVFVGLSLLVAGWRNIYKVRNEERLVTDGVYRVVRHPQYTGIFLAIFGQIVHWPTIPTLILFPIIVYLYYRLSRKEEKILLAKFGKSYRDYMRKVPMFFPPWKKLKPSAEKPKLNGQEEREISQVERG